MAKVLLVEDDNNLREIYEARLQAEGYDIVAAPDGEAALVVAKKELPDLVISDVMMPRISGFEMLDIMRNTDGLKDVKVIMLTALGQAEDKARADNLGADKYLVKSQVTLEDIVNSAAELLGGGGAPAPTTPSTAAAAAELAATPVAVAPAPVTPAPAMPVATPPPVTPVAAVPVASAPPEPTAAPVTPAPAAPVVPTMPDVTAPAAAPAPVADPVPAAPVAADPTPVTPVLPTAPATPAPTPEPVASSMPAAPVLPDPVAAQAAPATPASVTDDKLVADAVQDLIQGTDAADKSAPADEGPLQPPTKGKTIEPPALPEPAAATTPSAPPVPAAPAPDLTTPPAPAATPAPVTPVTPPEPVAPPAPAVDPAAAATVTEEEDSRPKRVIQPLSPEATKPLAPDLNALMAKEGRALDAVQPPTPAMPHQPGHVISPNPVGSTGQPEDPNKISL